MDKLNLQDLIKILSKDVLKSNSCIEMNFCIENTIEYKDCWLGKTTDRNNKNKELYWYGLVEDGTQVYDYDCLDDLLSAKVFNGKSMKDILERVTWYSLDGCSIEERLEYYK